MKKVTTPLERLAEDMGVLWDDAQLLNRRAPQPVDYSQFKLGFIYPRTWTQKRGGVEDLL